jgi:cell division protein FtsQ
MREALAQLVKLDAERQILSRDVVVVDLRLPDRVTVRLPEGRSLEDVTSPGAPEAAIPRART